MNTTTMFKIIYGLVLVLLVAACGPKREDSTEVAEEQNEEKFEDRDLEKDADFVVNTVASNHEEIKLAKLAKEKATDAKVKEMADKLEKDHARILEELTAYANKKGISVPLEESTEAQKDYSQLAEKTGGDFDEKWCETLEDKHEKTINNFERRLDKTEDPELKDWITATLPGLRTHLEMLKEHDDGAR
jgi:putative membrane protein